MEDHKTLATVGPWSIEAKTIRDEDASPVDADCYSAEDAEAWRDGRWGFVGFVAEVQFRGQTIGEGSLWSIEDGTWADGREVGPFADGYPIADVVGEAIDVARQFVADLTASVGDVDALTSLADAVEQFAAPLRDAARIAAAKAVQPVTDEEADDMLSGFVACALWLARPDDPDDASEMVPDDFEVRPIDSDDEDAADVATCGTCGLSWDDGVSTGRTPVPSGRCPFEPFHPIDSDGLDMWDLSAEAIDAAMADVRDFATGRTLRDLRAAVDQFGATWDSLGHDFYLTRNGYGAGFWDRGYGDIGERLTEDSKPYGDADLSLDPRDADVSGRLNWATI